jgi:hypothetical protein
MGWERDQVSLEFSNSENFIELYSLEKTFDQYGFKGD